MITRNDISSAVYVTEEVKHLSDNETAIETIATMRLSSQYVCLIDQYASQDREGTLRTLEDEIYQLMYGTLRIRLMDLQKRIEYGGEHKELHSKCASILELFE